MNISQTKESDSDDQTRPGGLHVLLVDDSVLVRERVAASLSAVKGVEAVRQAGDVPSGLRLMKARPDVMILDIEMPGQSGMDLLRIARQANYDGVIIMFSVYDHPRLRQKCVDLGADFYFHKMTEFQLVAEVCSEVAGRRAQQPRASAPGSNLPY
jgi:DNA-binding NarL/FixJ family response regulator